VRKKANNGNVLERVAPSIYDRLVCIVGNPDKIIAEPVKNFNKGISVYLLFLDGKIIFLDRNRKVMAEDARLLHDTSNNYERNTQLGGSYFNGKMCVFTFFQTIERPKGYEPEKYPYKKTRVVPLSTVAPTINDMFIEDMGDIGTLSLQLLSKSRMNNPAEHLHYAVFLNENCIGLLDCKKDHKNNGFSNDFKCGLKDNIGSLRMRYLEEIDYLSR
jgi:hypothetical protein